MNRKKTTTILLLLTIFSSGVWYGFSKAKEPPAVLPQNRADKILIEKAARKLYLLQKDKVLQEYQIALGFTPEGHKLQEGDGKTPEGIYKISGRNPNSKFHLSLRISYPNAADRKQAADRGVSPGGDIMIHGLPNSLPFLGSLHRKRDWTAGCIAVTNTEIEEIWSLVDNGTPVEIRP